MSVADWLQREQEQLEEVQETLERAAGIIQVRYLFHKECIHDQSVWNDHLTDLRSQVSMLSVQLGEINHEVKTTKCVLVMTLCS